MPAYVDDPGVGVGVGVAVAVGVGVGVAVAVGVGLVVVVEDDVDLGIDIEAASLRPQAIKRMAKIVHAAVFTARVAPGSTPPPTRSTVGRTGGRDASPQHAVYRCC
jgi:hypothetical protein